jgi:hypothetical protein
LIGTHRSAEFGETLLDEIPRADEQQFRFRDVHIGKS